MLLARAGVPPHLVDDAVVAYRRHYLDKGIRDAALFPGAAEMLITLRRQYRLATATMKLISTAVPFLQHHGIHDHFEVIGGGQEGAPLDKSAIIRHLATAAATNSSPADRTPSSTARRTCRQSLPGCSPSRRRGRFEIRPRSGPGNDWCRLTFAWPENCRGCPLE